MNSLTVIPDSFPSDVLPGGGTNEDNPALLYIEGLPSANSRRNIAYALNRFARDVWRLEDQRVVSGGSERTILALAFADWKQLRYKTITDYVNMLRQSNAKMATIGFYVAALKGVAREAFRIGQMSADVWARINIIKTKTPTDQERGRTLKPEEVRKLLNACADDKNKYQGLRDAAVIALMAHAGLRIVDIQRLTVGDISDDGKTLTVHGKGGRVDKHPISDSVLQRIKAWLVWRSKSCPMTKEHALICRVRKGGYVVSDKAISKTAMHDIVQKRVDMACAADTNPHDLRRTYCSFLSEKGVPIEINSQLMRHSSVTTTMRYIQHREARARETVDAINFEE